MITICHDLTKVEYIENKTERLLTEWGYDYDALFQKCICSDSEFLTFVSYHEDDEDAFEVRTRHLEYSFSLYKDSRIKTLLLFYVGNRVYYGWLDDLMAEGDIVFSKGSAFIPASSLFMKDFNQTKYYELKMLQDIKCDR